MIITENVQQIVSGQKMVDFIHVIIPRLTSPNAGILWKYSGWPRTRSTFEGLQEATVSPQGSMPLPRKDQDKHKEEKHNP